MRQSEMQDRAVRARSPPCRTAKCYEDESLTSDQGLVMEGFFAAIQTFFVCGTALVLAFVVLSRFPRAIAGVSRSDHGGNRGVSHGDEGQAGRLELGGNVGVGKSPWRVHAHYLRGHSLMYTLARLMLIVTIVACCFGVVIVAMCGRRIGSISASPSLSSRSPTGEKPAVYTAHGTARWATLSDLQYAGMVGAKRGPIIGRMANNAKTPLLKGLNDLFSFRVSSKEACEQFFDSIRFFNRPQRAFGTDQTAERRAYSGVRADWCRQGRVVRDPIPPYIA